MQASRSLCLLILLSISSQLIAQTQDSLTVESEDTLKWFERPAYQDLGIYTQISRQFAPTPGGIQYGGWVTIGAQFRKLSGGVYIATYEQSYQDILIFPTQFNMNYLHGGFFASYALIQKQWLQLNGTLSLGKGDVIWERSTSFENYYRDTFTMMQALIDIEFRKPLWFVRPVAQLGYRWMSPIEVPLMSAKDFRGLTAIVGIRIGLFTKSNAK